MDSTPSNPSLRSTALFSKRPRAGQVKTRLSPPLAPPQAAELAQAMLLDLAERLGACPELGCELRFAPAEAEAWFTRALPWISAREPQRGEGLGARLAQHFEARCGDPRVSSAVVVGSDCPLLSRASVLRAHELLEGGADLVLGPDQGGGYYLVGLRASAPWLFTEVAMSTDDMCSRSVALARERGLEVELLPALFDVDVESDLRMLARALEGAAPGPDHPARTAALLPALLASLPSST